MLAQLTGPIIHLIQTSGYVGIFVLMTMESALLPVPSEIVMTFSGFLVAQGSLSFALAVVAGAFGNLIGSLIGYALGYFLEERVILSFIEGRGKFFLLSKHDYNKSMLWLKKYGNSVVFFSRLLPVVRTYISLPAGLSEMNLKKFSLYTVLGSLLWSSLLTRIGFYLGANWSNINTYFKKFEALIIVILIAFFLFYLYRKLKILKSSN